MGCPDGIGVSTGVAADAAVTAATAAEQYEVIDLDFRAVSAGVADVVVEAPVIDGISAFCERHVPDLARLRAHMQSVAESTDLAGRAATETDRGNAERFEPWAR